MIFRPFLPGALCVLLAGGALLIPASCSQAQTTTTTTTTTTARTSIAASAIPGPGNISALRALVQGDEGAKKGWARVKRLADESLERAPQPGEKIFYEGLLGRDPNRQKSKRQLQDMSRIEMLDQAFAVTGDQKYRDKAREFVVAWAKTYVPTGNPINENKIMPALLSFAAHQDSYLPNERETVAKWVQSLGEKEIGTTARNRQNNWHTKRIGLVAVAGRALGNDEFLQYAVDESKTFIEASLRPDGSSWDFEERDALGYHFGAIKPFIRAAALIPTEKFDLWNYQSPSGASLRKSVEWTLPFIRGEKQHEEYKNSKVDIDLRRKAAGEIKPGQMFEPKKGTEALMLTTAFEPSFASDVEKLIAQGGIEAPSSDPGDNITLGYEPTWLFALARAGWALEKTD